MSSKGKKKRRFNNSNDLNWQSKIRCIFKNKPGTCKNPMSHASLKRHYKDIHHLNWNCDQVQYYLCNDLSQIYEGPAGKRRKLQSGRSVDAPQLQSSSITSITSIPPQIPSQTHPINPSIVKKRGIVNCSNG